MLFRRAGGKLVERECECHCGKVFKQNQVSKKFVETFLQTEHRVELFRFASPGGWLPVYCIPCERKALDREGREAERERR